MAGIEQKRRGQLSEILRESGPIISVDDAKRILKLPSSSAAKLMARWAEQGWLLRIRRGIYSSVSLKARSPKDAIENPWIIAERIAAPCYIGGWSAAEHWGLTEQIFRTVVVMTPRTFSKRTIAVQGTKLWLRKISQGKFFGTKIIWINGVRINISDESKTVADMLDDPSVAGGARSLTDIVAVYLKSNKDITTLLDYASRLGNGAIMKRLGYLLEKSGFRDTSRINDLQRKLTQGLTKLDPALPGKRLITRWRLWLPGENLENKND